MIVYVYPADVEACGYYRLIWASMYLKSQGHTIRVLHPGHPRRVMGDLSDDGKTLTSVNAPKDADVMVFQRMTSSIMLQAIKGWRDHGIAVVVDIDDDMSRISPNNPVWQTLHPTMEGERSGEYSWHTAQKICEAATLVTVSTDALINRYAPHGRGRVIHNVVPRATLDIKRRRLAAAPVTFGWGGTVRTHPDDPMVMGGAVARLQRDGFNFKVVGPSVGVMDKFKCDRGPEITGGVPITRWHHEIATFDVGISPLAGTMFNDAKSWLKPLEYSAVGVPWVASPRAEYRRLHALGLGLLADSPRDWYRHIRRLLLDDSLRADMAASGREVVRQRFVLEDNAWRWWEAWSDALKIQRGSSTTPFRPPLVGTTVTDERGPQTS